MLFTWKAGEVLVSNKFKIFGIEIDRVTMDEAITIFESLMYSDKTNQIVTPNSEIINCAKKDKSYAGVINRASLVIPDGIGLVIASKIKGAPLKERVAGIDFAYNALRSCARLKKTVFLLGGKPGVAKEAAEKLMAEIPDLQIVGTHDGYFLEEEEPYIAKEIRASKANFLLVATGFPKQEFFIARHKADLPDVKAAAGVGGSFDVWSGRTKRAPKFFLDHGLEWLYRTAKEPKRIKRIVVIPFFILKVLFDGKDK